MKIEILDPLEWRVNIFRNQLLEDELEKKNEEEVYKYSNEIWNRIGFDKLYGVTINGNVVAISGAKLYGNNIRFGMRYYVLQKYRKIVRSQLWKPGGLLSHTLIDFSEVDFSFVSIYPHNTKLQKWVDALKRKQRYGQIGNGSEHLQLLKTYTVYPDPIILNGVAQYIIYRNESNQLDVESLIMNIEIQQ